MLCVSIPERYGTWLQHAAGQDMVATDIPLIVERDIRPVRISAAACHGQQQLACIHVMTLLHGSVLRRGLEIAQPPLQW
jgi:hypothetical protein